MAYNAQIPQATDQISVSQGQILANFQFLNTIATGIFDAPVQLIAPVIPAGSNALYTLVPIVAPLTGKNELFLRNDGIAKNIPITASLQGNTGYSYLPSGILIKWGYVAPALPNPVTITYDPTVAFTTVFSVICQPVSPNPASDPNLYVTVDQNSVFANTTFCRAWTSPRITTGSTALQLFYIAIGI